VNGVQLHIKIRNSPVTVNDSAPIRISLCPPKKESFHNCHWLYMKGPLHTMYSHLQKIINAETFKLKCFHREWDSDFNLILTYEPNVSWLLIRPFVEFSLCKWIFLDPSIWMRCPFPDLIVEAIKLSTAIASPRNCTASGSSIEGPRPFYE